MDDRERLSEKLHGERGRLVGDPATPSPSPGRAVCYAALMLLVPAAGILLDGMIWLDGGKVTWQSLKQTAGVFWMLTAGGLGFAGLASVLLRGLRK